MMQIPPSFLPACCCLVYVRLVSCFSERLVHHSVVSCHGRQVMSVSIKRDRATGKNLGYGFVKLSSHQEARTAKEAMQVRFLFLVSRRSIHSIVCRQHSRLACPGSSRWLAIHPRVSKGTNINTLQGILAWSTTLLHTWKARLTGHNNRSTKVRRTQSLYMQQSIPGTYV